MSEVIVIGAGFSGLAAACHLAKGGAKVHVLERHHPVGIGEADAAELDGGDAHRSSHPAAARAPAAAATAIAALHCTTPAPPAVVSGIVPVKPRASIAR